MRLKIGNWATWVGGAGVLRVDLGLLDPVPHEDLITDVDVLVERPPGGLRHADAAVRRRVERAR